MPQVTAHRALIYGIPLVLAAILLFPVSATSDYYSIDPQVRGAIWTKSTTVLRSNLLFQAAGALGASRKWYESGRYYEKVELPSQLLPAAEELLKQGNMGRIDIFTDPYLKRTEVYIKTAEIVGGNLERHAYSLDAGWRLVKKW